MESSSLAQLIVSKFALQFGNDLLDHLRLVQNHDTRGTATGKPILFAFDADVMFLPQFAGRIVVVRGQQINCGSCKQSDPDG